MKFDELVALIQTTNEALQKRAVTAVNRSLVIRNWLVGMYIVEFEQHGEDRAKYGQALLATMTARLSHNKARGFSETNLRLFRQFYRIYTGIRQSLPDEFVQQFSLALPTESQAVDVQLFGIHQAVTDGKHSVNQFRRGQKKLRKGAFCSGHADRDRLYCQHVRRRYRSSQRVDPSERPGEFLASAARTGRQTGSSLEGKGA